jgi:hypothetical protein
MRIQLILSCLIFSMNLFAVDDKSMQDLFRKYDLVMDHKQVELIDEVFTQKFINSSGGKKELIQKIKELPTPTQKNLPANKLSWKKGIKGEIYFAKVKPVSGNKIKENPSDSEFIILNDEGKLKIDGTISDGN